MFAFYPMRIILSRHVINRCKYMREAVRNNVLQIYELIQFVATLPRHAVIDSKLTQLHCIGHTHITKLNCVASKHRPTNAYIQT